MDENQSYIEPMKKPERALRKNYDKENSIKDFDFSDEEDDTSTTRSWIKEMMKQRKADYSFQRAVRRRKLYE